MKKTRMPIKLQLSSHTVRALEVGVLDQVAGAMKPKTVSCAMGSCDDTSNRTVLCDP